MTEQDYNRVMRDLSAFLAVRSDDAVTAQDYNAAMAAIRNCLTGGSLGDLQRFYVTQISLQNARMAAELRAEREAIQAEGCILIEEVEPLSPEAYAQMMERLRGSKVKIDEAYHW
jgi:hypothetical protein